MLRLSKIIYLLFYSAGKEKPLLSETSLSRLFPSKEGSDSLAFHLFHLLLTNFGMGVSLKKKMETGIFCNFFQADYLPIFLLAISLKFKTDFLKFSQTIFSKP